MAGEPTTPNTALIVPNTGDLVGTWGSNALNPDFVAIDGMFGGSITLSLGAPALTTLTVPTSGTIAPAAGPNQSQNACITLVGTISGNQVIQLTMPGRYVFRNQIYNNPFQYYVQLQSAGAGRKIGLAPGKLTTVFHDGVNCDYVDTPDPGTAYDLHNIAFPAWMNACTIKPYLVKDGTVYTFSQYPALGNFLGGTFGGDGVSTFAVPDERARMRIAFDPGGGTGRMTSPINAAAMGSAGGEQAHTLALAEMPAHGHAGSTATDSGHTHTVNNAQAVNSFSAPGFPGPGPGTTVTSVGNANITLSIASAGGSGSHNNVQPGIVSFLALIKT